MEILVLVPALLAQAAGGAAYPPPDAAPADFRKYVWAAYGAVVVFLLAYSLWLSRSLRAAEAKLDHLQERIGGPGK